MSFERFAKWTLLSIFLIIVAGGIVRMTGSGMGCPDWPKCFGMWVPPISVDQLPVNYQEIFGAKLKGEVEFNATNNAATLLTKIQLEGKQSKADIASYKFNNA